MATVGEELFEFGSVSRLCGLSSLNEDLVHIVVVALAVFDTRFLLRRKAQVFDLILHGNSAVDDDSSGVCLLATRFHSTLGRGYEPHGLERPAALPVQFAPDLPFRGFEGGGKRERMYSAALSGLSRTLPGPLRT
jgi:hypothetical protein